MWLNHLTHFTGQLIRPYWRLRLEGDLDAIPREGPLLIASNHESFLDPWFLCILFPRRVRFLITERWYNRSPIWRFVFSSYATVPVNPGSPRDTISALCGVLEEGGVGGIFPEGRISYDGKIQRFRPGLARVAALSGAPVLPLGIRGAYESIPRTSRWPRPSNVTIHVGQPRTFPGGPHTTMPGIDARRAFSESIYCEICRLSGQEVLEEPALPLEMAQ